MAAVLRHGGNSYPARNRRVAQDSMERVDNSSVNEAAAWIAVGDVIAADEVVRRGGIIRVGWILIEDILAAERKPKIVEPQERRLSIHSFVGRDVTLRAGKIPRRIVVAFLKILAQRNIPQGCPLVL